MRTVASGVPSTSKLWTGVQDASQTISTSPTLLSTNSPRGTEGGWKLLGLGCDYQCKGLIVEDEQWLELWLAFQGMFCCISFKIGRMPVVLSLLTRTRELSNDTQ
jgi:hypothetical protein